MIAAVTGATGTVGRFIVGRLLAEGFLLRAWRRPSSTLAGMPAGIEWIDGALGSAKSAASLVAGADMLVHCALDHTPGKFRGGEGDDLPRFRRLNVGGSRDLLAAARDAGVGRCVVLSSRAVFGEAVYPGPIGDDAPVNPDTHYGAAKAELEACVRNFGRGQSWPIAALRPTGVYGMTGPVERNKWFALARAALDGAPVAARAGTEVHGRDVADAVWRLLTAMPEDVAGRMFNCSDLVVQSRDIVSLVHAHAKKSGPLPDLASVPANIMACEGLIKFGMSFGGRPLFEATVAELTDAVQATSQQSVGRGEHV